MTEHRPPSEVVLIAHTGRPPALEAARTVARSLLAAGLVVRALPDEAADLDVDGVIAVDADDARGDLALVVGGDGTLLRAAEVTRPHRVPLLGINLGHVGFLAEAERDAADAVARQVAQGRFTVDERTTVVASVVVEGRLVATEWALNEITVEKSGRERMVELVVGIDGRPLSRWGGDGVVCATPTGSTAYAFSAGGPVVWPDVDALLVVPISAHALFARPLVVAPSSVVALEVVATSAPAVLCSDGRRLVDLPPGAQVEVRRGDDPIHLVRLHPQPFTDRLVEKFDLPVNGWRGGGR